MPAGDYILLRQIGKGAYGIAHIAEHKANNQRYVMKKVRLAKQNPRERQASITELQLLSSLQHRNILKFVECWVEGGCVLCMVVELCEAGDLFTQIQLRVKNGPSHFSEQHLKECLVQLASALEHLHSRRIAHRDIKSSNVLVTASGCLKLADFGLSTLLETPDSLTRTFVGTLNYMGPELLEEKKYGTKNDIWGLGCVMHELSALKPAFQAFNMSGLVKKITSGAAPTLPSSYSEEWRALVRSLLAKEADKRPSAAEILAMPFLQDAIEAVEAKYGPAEPESSPCTFVLQPLPHELEELNEQFKQQQRPTVIAKLCRTNEMKLSEAHARKQAAVAKHTSTRPGPVHPSNKPSATPPQAHSRQASPGPQLEAATPTSIEAHSPLRPGTAASAISTIELLPSTQPYAATPQDSVLFDKLPPTAPAFEFTAAAQPVSFDFSPRAQAVKPLASTAASHSVSHTRLSGNTSASNTAAVKQQQAAANPQPAVTPAARPTTTAAAAPTSLSKEMAKQKATNTAPAAAGTPVSAARAAGPVASKPNVPSQPKPSNNTAISTHTPSTTARAAAKTHVSTVKPATADTTKPAHGSTRHESSMTQPVAPSPAHPATALGEAPSPTVSVSRQGAPSTSTAPIKPAQTQDISPTKHVHTSAQPRSPQASTQAATRTPSAVPASLPTSPAPKVPPVTTRRPATAALPAQSKMRPTSAPPVSLAPNKQAAAAAANPTASSAASSTTQAATTNSTCVPAGLNTPATAAILPDSASSSGISEAMSTAAGQAAADTTVLASLTSPDAAVPRKVAAGTSTPPRTPATGPISNPTPAVAQSVAYSAGLTVSHGQSAEAADTAPPAPIATRPTSTSSTIPPAVTVPSTQESTSVTPVISVATSTGSTASSNTAAVPPVAATPPDTAVTTPTFATQVNKPTKSAGKPASRPSTPASLLEHSSLDEVDTKHTATPRTVPTALPSTSHTSASFPVHATHNPLFESNRNIKVQPEPVAVMPRAHASNTPGAAASSSSFKAQSVPSSNTVPATTTSAGLASVAASNNTSAGTVAPRPSTGTNTSAATAGMASSPPKRTAVQQPAPALPNVAATPSMQSSVPAASTPLVSSQSSSPLSMQPPPHSEAVETGAAPTNAATNTSTATTSSTPAAAANKVPLTAAAVSRQLSNISSSTSKLLSAATPAAITQPASSLSLEDGVDLDDLPSSGMALAEVPEEEEYEEDWDDPGDDVKDIKVPLIPSPEDEYDEDDYDDDWELDGGLSSTIEIEGPVGMLNGTGVSSLHSTMSTTQHTNQTMQTLNGSGTGGAAKRAWQPQQPLHAASGCSSEGSSPTVASMLPEKSYFAPASIPSSSHVSSQHSMAPAVSPQHNMSLNNVAASTAGQPSESSRSASQPSRPSSTKGASSPSIPTPATTYTSSLHSTPAAAPLEPGKATPPPIRAPSRGSISLLDSSFRKNNQGDDTASGRMEALEELYPIQPPARSTALPSTPAPARPSSSNRSSHDGSHAATTPPENGKPAAVSHPPPSLSGPQPVQRLDGHGQPESARLNTSLHNSQQPSSHKRSWLGS